MFNSSSDHNTSSTNSSGGGMGFGSVCDSYTTNYKDILMATFYFFVMFANLLGNSLVIFACTHSSQLKKRKNTYFIVSLACSDMIYAIGVLPILISMQLHRRNYCHSLATCYFVQIMDPISNVSGMINILIIAIDRFIAITIPYRYTTIVTATRAKILLVSSWVFIITWSFIGFFQWGKFTTKQKTWSPAIENYYIRTCAKTNNSYYFAASFIGVYIIPLIISTITYSMVLYVAFTQIKAIKITTVTSTNLSPGEGKRQKAKEKRQKEWKATKSIGSVYMCYFLCWFPLFVINMIILYNPFSFRKISAESRQAIAYVFVEILPALNTMLNPLIYSFSNKYFRDAFQMAFNRFIGRRLTHQSEGNTFARSTTGTLSLTSVSCIDNHNSSQHKINTVKREFVMNHPPPVKNQNDNLAFEPDDK